jgi:hypothetical protein
MWDTEGSLQLSDILDNPKFNDTGVAEPNKLMRSSEEYRVRMGDRAHRSLFHRGAFTPGRCVARYSQVTRLHPSILVPELARWGDQHGDNHSLEQWETERDSILRNWCQTRTNEFLDSLRSADPPLYPLLDAPEYDHMGGATPRGTKIKIVAPVTATDVYYILGPESVKGRDWQNKLDPRVLGGGINPKAKRIEIIGTKLPRQFLTSGDVWKYLDDGSDQGTAWRETNFDDSGWQSGPSQLGYGEGDERTVVGFIDSNPQRSGVQRNATTYFRKAVEIPDPDRFSFLQFEIVYDDAYAIYVNGREVARQPSLPRDPAFDRYSRYLVSRENAVGTLRVPTSAFESGKNTIAVEIHQVYSGSSDMSFDLTLAGRSLPTFETPEPVTGNVWLTSRSYDRESKTWSALNTEFFSVDTEPAGPGNIVISRIGFNPVSSKSGDVTADGSKFEYVELTNINRDKSVDLTGVAFVSGIRFDFHDHTSIPPGGRIVIVSDRSAFEKRVRARIRHITYGFDHRGGVEFAGNLDNEGERIALYSRSQGVIHSFVYNSNQGSPATDGYTLVLLHPETAPDHGTETNWLLTSDALFGVN